MANAAQAELVAKGDVTPAELAEADTPGVR
jgi:hypothetical protein